MRSKTKKLAAVLIVFVMVGSSLAYVLLSTIPEQQTSSSPHLPSSFVIEGRISEQTMAFVLQRGYSVAEWHYFTGCCPELNTFIDDLPQWTALPNGQPQLFVQKINDLNVNTTPFLVVYSINGNASVNVTKPKDLLLPICKVLLYPPMECGISS